MDTYLDTVAESEQNIEVNNSKCLCIFGYEGICFMFYNGILQKQIQDMVNIENDAVDVNENHEV